MSKENSKISINQIDKIIAAQSDKYPKNNKTVISYDVRNGETVDIEVTPLLSLDDMDGFVEGVTEGIFDNDTYKPALYEIVYSQAILCFYTNLKTDMTNDKLIQIVYNTDIVDMVIDKINVMQLADINDALEKAIEFKKQSILSEQRKLLSETNMTMQIEQNEVISKMDSVINLFKNISSGLDDYGKKQLAEDINKIANTDEKVIVDNILDFQEKQKTMNSESVGEQK